MLVNRCSCKWDYRQIKINAGLKLILPEQEWNFAYLHISMFICVFVNLLQIPHISTRDQARWKRIKFNLLKMTPLLKYWVFSSWRLVVCSTRRGLELGTGPDPSWAAKADTKGHQGAPRGHKRIFWTSSSMIETFLRSYVYIYVSTGHQKTIFLVTGDTAWGRFLNHLLASQRSQMALASTYRLLGPVSKNES